MAQVYDHLVPNLTGGMNQVSPSNNENKVTSTWFFSCRNHAEQKNFEKFQRTDLSLKTLLLFVIISTLSAFINKALSYRNYPTTLAVSSAICSVVFEIILGWSFLIILHKFKRYLSSSSRWESIVGVIENVYVFGYNLSLIMSAFVIVSNGYCPSHEVYTKNIGCNSSSKNQFQEGTMALFLMAPIMLSTIVKSAKSEMIFFIWFQNFGILVYFFTAYDFRLSVGSFILFSFITFICLYEFQRQKIAMYFVAQNLRGVQNENERLAEENRASELKHLIGNVAHDLKTPLSSLNMGIDLINGVLEELAALTANDIEQVVRARVYAFISTIEDNLLNMRNYNSFMLMSINRCMDYTKASNGLKLVPKNETAPLLETIALPLHVINATHESKTHIELRPIPQTIASHIITDKQWLQENILCLLSNATKYSNRGVVAITISLVEREPRRVTIVTPPVSTNILSVSPSQTLSQKPSPASSMKYQLWRTISYLPSKAERQAAEIKDLELGLFRSESKDGKETSITRKPSDSSRISLNIPAPITITTTTVTSPTTVTVTTPTVKSIRVGPNASRLSCKGTIPMLRIEVEDGGIGLTDEVMENLFSPFKQAQRLAGGTGLGLFSLSRRIDAVGGHYGCQKRSDGQEGSVFWFEIPYKPDSEYAANISQFTPHQSFSTVNLTSQRRPPPLIRAISNRTAVDRDGNAGQTGSPKESERTLSYSPNFAMSSSSKSNANANRISLNILLADDTLSIQKMTSMLLKRCGHTVTIAENGADALELIQAKYSEPDLCRSPFDVVLMDFQMPIMDGLEATRRIRAYEEKLKKEQQKRDLSMSMSDFDNSACALSYHQRIIGLSANSDEETVQLALDAGLDDFMEKPFKATIFDDIYNRLSV